MTNLITTIIKESLNLEDGETGTDKCIENYCQSNNISEEIMLKAQEKAFDDGALSTGIPLQVISGQKSIKDIFSQEYINFKCNK